MACHGMLFFTVSCPPTIRAPEEGRPPQEDGVGGLPVGGNGGVGGADGVGAAWIGKKTVVD